MATCWICGEEAKTGEHLIKASDIRDYFGEITQKNPVYFHDGEAKNRKVGSAKSDKFKSDALICANCNNAQTAPYDKAWEKMSRHLSNYDLAKRGSLKIRLSKIYGTDIYLNSLYVHLYFVKLFGCRIIENDIPIDIAPLSKSLLACKPNPNIFLVFKKAAKDKINMAAVSPIHAEFMSNQIVVAGWIYTLGELNIEVLYSPNSAHNDFLKRSFHPKCQNRVLRFLDFDSDEAQ